MKLSNDHIYSVEEFARKGYLLTSLILKFGQLVWSMYIQYAAGTYQELSCPSAHLTLVVPQISLWLEL